MSWLIHGMMLFRGVLAPASLKHRPHQAPGVETGHGLFRGTLAPASLSARVHVDSSPRCLHGSESP